MKMRLPVDFETNRNGWWYLQDAGDVYHPGIDFNYGNGAQDQGLPVYAIADGAVVFVDKSGYNEGWGEHVYIRHEDKGEVFYSHYAHMQNTRVTIGDVVQCGLQIGEIGKSGNPAYSPHLHFEIMKNPMYDYFILRKGHEFYPTKKQGWSAEDVSDMYYHPIEFINNNNAVNELQEYVDFCKDKNWLVDNTDTERPMTRGEVCKLVVNMYKDLTN